MVKNDEKEMSSNENIADIKKRDTDSAPNDRLIVGEINREDLPTCMLSPKLGIYETPAIRVKVIEFLLNTMDLDVVGSVDSYTDMNDVD